MKRAIVILLSVVCCMSAAFAQQSTRKERNFITEGNKLYKEGKYPQAAAAYQKALAENSQSMAARYNLGLSQLQMSNMPEMPQDKKQEIKQNAMENLGAAASVTDRSAHIASLANYNLGNVAFNEQQYKQALEYYKQALRLNPNDEAARRNLRITQKKLQNQDNQNQDQNQDQQQDKKDKQQDQDQNKDQDKQQDQQQQQNQQQQQQQQQDQINEQTAAQILKSMENKENETRNRVNAINNGEKSAAQRGGRKNW